MNVRFFVQAAVLAALLLSASACNWLTTEESSTDSLSGTAWELVSFAVPGEQPADTTNLKGRYTLSFADGGGRMSAQADCNECGGAYEARADGSIAAALVCTRLACNRSAEFSGAVNVAERYEASHDQLRLFYTDPPSDSARVLVFRPLAER